MATKRAIKKSAAKARKSKLAEVYVVRKKSAAKKPAAKRVAKVSEPYRKSQILEYLTETADISRKQANTVLNQLVELIRLHLHKSGPGEFKLPGILKMSLRRTPAKKARTGISPFTGEPMVFKAKPASTKVRITALKQLKTMVNA